MSASSFEEAEGQLHPESYCWGQTFAKKMLQHFTE